MLFQVQMQVLCFFYFIAYSPDWYRFSSKTIHIVQNNQAED